MSQTWRPRAASVVVLAVFTALGLLAKPVGRVDAGQSGREAEGARQLKGAIDMHFHVDAATPGKPPGFANIADVRLAHSRGMRGLVIKNHHEPTGSLAYLLRMEIPNFDLFGGIVMNFTNGGENPAAVEFMATQIDGNPGRVVWMPAGDSEIESLISKAPTKPPFVAVSRNGALVPEVKAILSLIAKHGLILASGHISPEDALMLFTEARKQGVQHMIATHAMDLAGKMTIDQMLAAAKLGAIIEFDFRNILSEEGRRADAIRKIGPEHCLISEFWTKNQVPKEYGGLDGVGAFVDAMHARGFTDPELDLMFKENPARLLGLSGK